VVANVLLPVTPGILRKPPLISKKTPIPGYNQFWFGRTRGGAFTEAHIKISSTLVEIPARDFGEVSQGSTGYSGIYHRMGSPGEPPA